MEDENTRRNRPFAALLPEIYKDDPALDALMTVFERCHRNLERMIERMPERLYEPAMTPEPFLDFVGAALGLRNENRQFTPAQMRDLLPAAFWIHRRKGTRLALEYILARYLRLLCGYPVSFLVLEPGEGGMPETAPGERPRIVVRVAPEAALRGQGERVRLEMLVRDYTPATVDCYVEYGQGTLGTICLGYDSMI